MSEQEKEKIVNEPKKHHYIPQFILRNFYNQDDQVLYWDIEKKTLSKRNTKKIFMNMNMYRDEVNNVDNPTIIEKSFSVFEEEIAKLIRDKFIDKSVIEITRGELEKLRIFLELLSFRSDSRMKQYKEKSFTPETMEILKEYQPNEDYEDLWKKELLELTKCRCLKDIVDSTVIDPIIKVDFENSYKGYYMTILDARGGEFILSDIYPTLEIFPLVDANIHLHAFYPISPTRAILLNHIMFKKEAKTAGTVMEYFINMSRIKGDLIRQPIPKYKKSPMEHTLDDLFPYKPAKIYENDLNYVNALILNEAKVGLMFRNTEKVNSFVKNFNLRDDTKVSYPELEEALEKM